MVSYLLILGRFSLPLYNSCELWHLYNKGRNLNMNPCAIIPDGNCRPSVYIKPQKTNMSRLKKRERFHFFPLLKIIPKHFAAVVHNTTSYVMSSAISLCFASHQLLSFLSDVVNSFIQYSGG